MPFAFWILTFKTMFLIVGLGNPGKKYENTRHNIGVRVIENLAPLSLANVILAKPTTFMNNSGKAVRSLVASYKLPVTSLLVIHDDIDLPLGKIKIVKNRGAAGHKGVESIIENLRTKDFIRLRMGIQPKTGKPERAESFVLKKFTKSEEKILKNVIKKTTEAIGVLIKDGPEKAM
ncbi:MAG: aminoacyl-tRNA hydrolase, partial [Patescibacteria group bacterium]